MLKKITFLGLLLSVMLTTISNGQVFTIDDNGIVKCEGVEPGDTGTIFGDTYTAVDRNMLIAMIGNNEDVALVCTSLITDMRDLFKSRSSFNTDIGSWDVSSVTNMDHMFSDAYVFNQDISSWDVSSVTSMVRMFWNADDFNQDLSNWDVSSVTNMTYMFGGTDEFNSDIGMWDVSSVTNMDYMFYVAIGFNKALNTWDVSSVTNMNNMFQDAKSFNQDLNDWDVSSVVIMNSMFKGAISFNGRISNWDVSSVTNMDHMFSDAYVFNQDISSWDVSSVTSMVRMFGNADDFNQDLSNWDVSNVENMAYMFGGTDYFNSDLKNWDVSSVNSMESMFFEATGFNKALNTWDVSSVTNMNNMFRDATSFNGEISNWNVSSVSNMDYMFRGAASMNRDLSNWCVEQIQTEPTEFAEGSSLQENYLPIWGTCPYKPFQIVLNTPDNSSSDISIIPTFSWQIDSNATNYKLQIIEGFDPVVIDTILVDTSFTISDSLKGEFEYNWRVRGINETKNLTGEWSEIWSFTTEAIPVGKIKLVTPVNDSKNVKISPTLVWHNDIHADSFLVQLSTDEFTSIIVNESLTDTSFTVPELSNGTQYSWRVRAENAGGVGEWSDIGSFTTRFAEPNVVSLLSPENESTIHNDKPPILTWSSSERASEYILHFAEDEAFEEMMIDTTLIVSEQELNDSDTTFTVQNELFGYETYFWRVKSKNETGESNWSETFSFSIFGGLSTETETLPTELTLHQNYPNPFNPKTQIRYGIPTSSKVNIAVYNMLGQQVTTLVNDRKSAGWHTTTFDASSLASGLYIYRIQAGKFVSTKKLMLIK